jgi:type III secretion system YopN/LcrE/InvE/MxiC family regulator
MPVDAPDAPLVSVQEWLANASEERSFEFSATFEAQQKSLEERLEPESHGLADITVDRIRHVLELMEGPESHANVRDTARRLASGYQQGAPADVRQQFAPPTLDPGKRYGFMRLALEELSQRGDVDASQRLSDDLEALCTGEGSRVRASLNIAAVANEFSAGSAGRQDDFRGTYYQMIETTPTVKSLFEKLTELGGDGGLNKTHHLLQRALWMDLQAVSPSMDKIHLLQAAGAITYLGQVCQSMAVFARDLIGRFGEVGLRADGLGQTAFETRCARELVGLADSMSPPRSLLERVAALLMGKVVERRRTVIFYNALYSQTMLWPLAVWPVPDRKENVQQQLRKLLEKHRQA